jgi:hypothetical protein
MKPNSVAFGFLAAISAVTLGADNVKAPADKELLEKLEKGVAKVKALEAVLKKSDGFSPSVLRAGMLVALHEKRFEDGAFLFFVGVWRADFDRECFPAEGLSGVGPFLVDSIYAQLFVKLPPGTVMKDPVAFTRVIDRLKKWSPQVPKDYDPGYNFKERRSEKAALEATKAKRTEAIRLLSDISILLNDAEYFAAFRVNQAFKHASEEKRPTRAENETATNTMKRIEKAKYVKASFVE